MKGIIFTALLALGAAAGSTVPATTGLGSGALGLYSSPALGETAAIGSRLGSVAGPLTLYSSPALGETASAGPFYASAPSLWSTAAKSGWGDIGGMRGQVKEGIQAGMFGEQYVKERPR
jgi:hypothetical protein